jgi:hypothetical protein
VRRSNELVLFNKKKLVDIESRIEKRATTYPMHTIAWIYQIQSMTSGHSSSSHMQEREPEGEASRHKVCLMIEKLD